MKLLRDQQDSFFEIESTLRQYCAVPEVDVEDVDRSLSVLLVIM